MKRENRTPSIREIGERFNISSTGVVHHLQLIEEKGFIARESGRSRSIQILMDPYAVEHLPIIGEVVDKKLIRFEVPEQMDLGKLFNDPRCFIILQNDNYLVIRKQRSAKRGQTVAVTGKEDKFFLKTWPCPETLNIKLLGRLMATITLH